MDLSHSSLLQKIYRILRVTARFIARLLKSIWLFFPPILFIGLAVWCFWILDQGKDLIVAFAENASAKFYFFIAISFWVYVSWYSSRVIAYLKWDTLTRYKAGAGPRIGEGKEGPENPQSQETAVPPAEKAPEAGRTSQVEKRQETAGAKAAGRPGAVRDGGASGMDKALSLFPRLIGYCCFLVTELAVLQSPGFRHPLQAGWAAGLFFAGLLLFILLDRKVETWAGKNAGRWRAFFNASLGLFVAGLLATALAPVLKSSLSCFFWLLCWLHIVFLLYINLRRKKVEGLEGQPVRDQVRQVAHFNVAPGLVAGIMRFFRIPAAEIGYFIWFNIFSTAGLVLFILAVLRLHFAILLGPFPVVILAFALLPGLGNIVSSGSVKTGVNVHFLVFLLAVLFSWPENHYVRTIPLADAGRAGIFHQRQGIDEYFSRWIAQRKEIDEWPADRPYPVYFVLSDGGASRSAYWTASVLGRLEDASIRKGQGDDFSRHVFCLSGTSGGGVGVAAFFSLLKSAQEAGTRKPFFEQSARLFLEQDFLSFTMARMLGPDYFKYIFHCSPLEDRAGALESSFEGATDTSCYPLRFGTPVDSCLAIRGQDYGLPILCINTTRMQDGSPGIVSNIEITKSLFNGRVDVLSLLDSGYSLRLSTASLLGARFPYMSPAGRIDQKIPRKTGPPTVYDSCCRVHYFVDGGYFDNSGAGVVQEMINVLTKNAASSRDTLLRTRSSRLQIIILHITNSPVGEAVISETDPLANDLLSPAFTMLGAYNMQTSINDKRLRSFIDDLNKPGDSTPIHQARYQPLHLYRDFSDQRDTLPQGSYTMNWFISDTVRRRMDQRLNTQPALQEMLK